MGQAVFTAAIFCPDISDADREKLRKQLQYIIYDELDESEIDYQSLFLDFVTEDKDLDDLIEDRPDANSIGGFRSSDPDTSRKGAIDAYPLSGSQKWKILVAIYKSGPQGLTYEEVEQKTGIKNAHKRISDLKNGNWVYDEGERLARLTKSMAAIHKVTPRAERYIEQKEKASVIR